MSQPSILFVCLGNICRSPLAEAALRAQSVAAGVAAILTFAERFLNRRLATIICGSNLTEEQVKAWVL